MALPCSICPHPNRKEIEEGLVRGESVRGMARRYGVSASAISRHRDSHLRAALGKALEEHRLDVDAARLVGWAGHLHTRTLLLLERAERLDDLANARGLIQEARRNIELLGRLGGVLEGPTVHVDMRKQLQVVAGLTTSELRALASGDVIDGELVEAEPLELVEAAS